MTMRDKALEAAAITTGPVAPEESEAALKAEARFAKLFALLCPSSQGTST